MATTANFKAMTEVAVKSRLTSEVEELRRKVAAQSGAAVGGPCHVIEHSSDPRLLSQMTWPALFVCREVASRLGAGRKDHAKLSNTVQTLVC